MEMRKKQECQESLCSHPTYRSTLLLFFLFSCICLMLHRIFTLKLKQSSPVGGLVLCFSRGAVTANMAKHFSFPSPKPESTAGLSRWETALVHQLLARLRLSQSSSSLCSRLLKTLSPAHHTKAGSHHTNHELYWTAQNTGQSKRCLFSNAISS